jgi:hypothetical protein
MARISVKFFKTWSSSAVLRSCYFDLEGQRDIRTCLKFYSTYTSLKHY